MKSFDKRGGPLRVIIVRMPPRKGELRVRVVTPPGGGGDAVSDRVCGGSIGNLLHTNEAIRGFYSSA